MEYKFVKNEKKYFDFIRKLRNANHNDGFTEQVNITEEQQSKYMEKYESNYFICLDGNDPVGFIGQINGDIRVATLPEYFGKGVGLFLVNNLMEVCPDSFAKVKVDNVASYNLFKKAGFEPIFIIMKKK